MPLFSSLSVCHWQLECLVEVAFSVLGLCLSVLLFLQELGFVVIWLSFSVRIVTIAFNALSPLSCFSLFDGFLSKCLRRKQQQSNTTVLLVFFILFCLRFFAPPSIYTISLIVFAVSWLDLLHCYQGERERLTLSAMEIESSRRCTSWPFAALTLNLYNINT